FDFGERKTFLVDPPTDLLSRVQAFLPALEASNSQLLQQAKNDPRSVDIEHIDDSVQQHIEMNLGLGLFEKRAKGASEGDASSSD
ncbi:hypothetical protein HETIRDRAFT_17676, partial [Heterobasidion irregulare TC 32-1]